MSKTYTEVKEYHVWVTDGLFKEEPNFKASSPQEAKAWGDKCGHKYSIAVLTTWYLGGVKEGSGYILF